jgi:phosphopantothenoylcysteine synthetase/decarboxylase
VKHKRIVVASGPTREWLDPVRFISNPSSGRMGYAIARAALERVPEVCYVCGPGLEAFRKVEGARNTQVDTTEEMLAAVLNEVKPGTILIMAAAPADYTPVVAATSKIKKEMGKYIEITFKPTPDILREVAAREIPDTVRVGFAAETDHMRENALAKMESKKLDMICANQVFKDGVGFTAETGALLCMEKSGAETTLGPAHKDELGRKLVDLVLERFSG